MILLKDIIFQFDKDMGGLFNNGEEPMSCVTSGKGKKAILIQFYGNWPHSFGPGKNKDEVTPGMMEILRCIHLQIPRGGHIWYNSTKDEVTYHITCLGDRTVPAMEFLKRGLELFKEGNAEVLKGC